MHPIKRIACVAIASIAAALGFIGVFIPVLPTTPLLLLAAFLFSRSSERLDAWLRSTPVYKKYVEPFKGNGGIEFKRKVYIVTISFVIMGISGVLVQRWYVWLVLAAVGAWLLYLMFVRIPTLGKEKGAPAAQAAEKARRCSISSAQADE